MKAKVFRMFVALIVLSMLAIPASASPTAQQTDDVTASTTAETTNQGLKVSHRLIVELDSPPLAVHARQTGRMLAPDGALALNSPAAQAYVSQLEAEQASFVRTMQAALPAASVGTYLNEQGASVALTYQVAFNGMAIDPGTEDLRAARLALASLPGVKAVYLDRAYEPNLFSSLPWINAPMFWEEHFPGGREDAGLGIRVASMDGGIHSDAPMFSGENMPPPPPPYPLGHIDNTNNKVIVSRVYFRPWDPPAPGDENPWPGVNGTPHGNHTSGIAAGNVVSATYIGYTTTISGVAPKAYLMSYRVFYNSITGDESFYTAEGIAALEDIAADGAHVVNNSWGGGPGSRGGEFDPLDTALANVWNAGVFVSMSAGNAGPGAGTVDHPSDQYISSAATTKPLYLVAGDASVGGPGEVPPDLQNFPFAGAAFGPGLDLGVTIEYPYLPASAVDPGNAEGCTPWAGMPFEGRAALILRGSCDFSLKVLNAQLAGAEFVVVYNHATGGEELISMGAGEGAGDVTIPSIFIAHSKGVAMTDWYAANGDASTIVVSTLAREAESLPDVVIDFSSRGPGVGFVAKPDIAAPGVNILSQGYTPGVTGEARHLGFGQVSGTSMAAPHTSGAAALVRQVHKTWSNDWIKSALMSTSKYIGVYNEDGTHAQPLDMGAGRLDLTNVADPGVVLDPPSVSFGLVPTDTLVTMPVTVTSVATDTETYMLSTVNITATDFTTPNVTAHPHFSVSPAEITLDPGETITFSVSISPTNAPVGDVQGYVVMDGDNHEAHLPAWGRILADPAADVLIIDVDGSTSTIDVFQDYLEYYTSTLDELGLTYDVWDANVFEGSTTTIPIAAELAAYRAIIIYTGDYWVPNNFFTVPTPLTEQDTNRLTEYANGGGIILAMGQDLSSVLNSTDPNSSLFLYSSVLGGEFLQDSVTDGQLPTLPVVPLTEVAPAFEDIHLDLGSLPVSRVELTGANEVPPVATDSSGEAFFAYNDSANQLLYDVTVFAGPDPITVTASHIHTGTVGVNGPVLYPLFLTPTLVTDTLNFAGSVDILPEHEDELLAGDLYINVHTTDNPGGELRAQVMVNQGGDGANNQLFIDEIVTHPFDSPDPVDQPELLYRPLLRYPGPNNIEDGTVAMAHRDQPTLERPGVTYDGRSVYTTFGLEGVNNGVPGATTRAELVSTFLNWAMDEPTATITQVTTETNSSQLTQFQAMVTTNLTETVPITESVGVRYRWDFGDGSPYTTYFESDTVGHTYEECGVYTVRVEAVDIWGNHTVGSGEFEVQNCMANEPQPMYRYFFPFVPAASEIIQSPTTRLLR